MNGPENWRGWRTWPLAVLLSCSACAHREPVPCPPPVLVRPVLPPVEVKPEGYFQQRLEAILAPYSQPSSGDSPSKPTG